MSSDTIKEKIKALREERKMTQTDVAKACNISQQAIQSWEKGKTQPGYDSLISLAKVFLVTTDYLLGLTDQRRPAASTQANSFLSADEAKIIQQYRQLDEKGKNTIAAVMEAQLQAPAKPEPAVATAGDEQTFQKEAIL